MKINQIKDFKYLFCRDIFVIRMSFNEKNINIWIRLENIWKNILGKKFYEIVR